MSDIITQLKALKLHGMVDCYVELQNQGASGATASMESSEWLLRNLLEAESADRGIRSISYQMHVARFPVHRDLAGDCDPNLIRTTTYDANGFIASTVKQRVKLSTNQRPIVSTFLSC